MTAAVPQNNNVVALNVDLLTESAPTTVDSFAETRILLEGISWETYERLLDETGENRHQKFAYRDGILEIMVPLKDQEEPIRLLDQFLAAMVDELNLEFLSLGSLTMKQAQQKMGLEPDCCFYIKNEAVVRGVDTLDFAIHPPPDLVIEVDNSSSSLSKFPIYVALKIPEIWRLRQGKLMVYHLDDQQSDYQQSDHSLAFSRLPVQELPQFIELAKQIGQRAAVKAWAKRVRQALN